MVEPTSAERRPDADPPRRRAAWRLPLLVLAVSLTLKLGVFLLVWAVDKERVVGGDTASYERPARALVATGRFARDPAEPDVPEMLRTPGYPAFIAATYLIFGEGRTAVVVGQILISTITLALTFLLARRLWDGPAARLALVALAVDPVSFVYAQLLFSETLFTLALVAAVYAGVRVLGDERTRWALLFGFFWASATLIRPIAYYLFAPLLLGLVVHRRLRRGRWQPALVAALLAALPWIALVEGWRLRNYQLTGSAELSDIKVVNLLWYRAAGVVAARDGLSFREARERVARALPATTGWPAGAVDALYRREGLAVILAHPVLFLKVELYGLLKVTAGPGRADLLHYFTGAPYEDAPGAEVRVTAEDVRARLAGGGFWSLLLIGYASAYLALLYAGVGRGLAAALGERYLAAIHVLLVAAIAYFVVIAAGPEAYARFRVPVMPFLALYAGRGWQLWVGESRAPNP